jgi:3-oxoacyl-ACP reductase-like protein
MKSSLRTFVALVALAFAVNAYAQAASPAPQAPAPQAPAAPAQQAPGQAAAATAQGELLEVDAKANTFSIKTAAAEMKFRYDDSTKVTGAQKGVAGLATMTGSQVTVQYKKEGANNIATSIEVRGEKGGDRGPAPGAPPRP